MEIVGETVRVLSWAATFAIMLGATLRLSPAALRRAAAQSRLFLRALAVIWIGVPLLTALVVLVLGVRGTSAALLLLMSVCPGVPLLLASTRKIRGEMTTAFLALVLTAATEPLLIPFWTRLVSRFLPVDLTVQAADVLDVLLPMVFLPVALGLLIRDVSPRATAILARASDVAYLLGISISVVAVLLQGVPVLPRVPPQAIVAAVIVTIGNAIMGYWAGGPAIEGRKAVALAASLGNPALAIAVVAVSYPELQATVLVAVYLVVRGATMLPIEWFLKRRVGMQQ